MSDESATSKTGWDMDDMVGRAQWIADHASVYPEDLQREIYRAMKAVASDAGLRIYALEQRIAELEASLFTANVNLAALRVAYDQLLAERSEWEPVTTGEIACECSDPDCQRVAFLDGDTLGMTDGDADVWMSLPDGYAVCRRTGEEGSE